MEPIAKRDESLAVLRHLMTHGAIALLAVAIAFAAPNVARYILYAG